MQKKEKNIMKIWATLAAQKIFKPRRTDSLQVDSTKRPGSRLEDKDIIFSRIKKYYYC